MPFRTSVVNGFVQISAVLTTTLDYGFDGARFYQLPRDEYSSKRKKGQKYASRAAAR